MKRTFRSRRWAPSIAAVAAFGALGATGAYWALQLFAPPVAIAPAGSLVDTRSAPDLAAAQALFGSSTSDAIVAGSPDVDVRVLGVAASPTRGSAVLVIDSGAAKAYLVGDELGTDLRLVEVRSDAAVLERNGKRIELPAPQRPSVALLSSGQNAANASAGQAPPPIERDERDADAGDRSAGAGAPAASDARNAPLPPNAAGTPNANGLRPTPVVPDIPDDPATEAATLSPRGAPVVEPGRLSGIRSGSVRNLGTPANAAAPPGNAAH
ncbi:MAG TPA: type II secretion system protein N [Zeimonas sp.]